MILFPIILNMDSTNCIVTRNSRGSNIITNTIYDNINNINRNNNNNTTTNDNSNKVLLLEWIIKNFGDNFKIKIH